MTASRPVIAMSLFLIVAWPAFSKEPPTPEHTGIKALLRGFVGDVKHLPAKDNAYLALLKLDGTMTLVGAPEKPAPVAAFNLIMGRRRLVGSGIGGIRQTQEMLDFCAEHNITSDVEVIRAQQLNEAYERLLKSDVKYRFVIDVDSLK